MAKELSFRGFAGQSAPVYATFDNVLNVEIKDVKVDDTFVCSDELAATLLADFAEAGPSSGKDKKPAFVVTKEKVEDPKKGPAPKVPPTRQQK